MFYRKCYDNKRLSPSGDDEFVECYFERITFDCRNMAGRVKLKNCHFANCRITGKDGVTRDIETMQDFHDALTVFDASNEQSR